MHGCQNCRSTDVLEVTLEVREGPVRFRQCRRCEHRWWDSVNGAVSLRVVLDRVA
jgi:DNA-directed RNA polymerase subunit M/transcription elongation factor TFIIS